MPVKNHGLDLHFCNPIGRNAVFGGFMSSDFCRHQLQMVSRYSQYRPLAVELIHECRKLIDYLSGNNSQVGQVKPSAESELRITYCGNEYSIEFRFRPSDSSSAFLVSNETEGISRRVPVVFSTQYPTVVFGRSHSMGNIEASEHLLSIALGLTPDADHS